MVKENKDAQIENLEIRNLKVVDEIELRVSGESDSLKITGYAAKFDKWSEDLGWFIERIQKGAFDEALKTSDVRALKNHDSNLLLGRTPDSLKLETDSIGLRFEISPPDTGTAKDTIEEIRHKILTGCSFAFTVAEHSWDDEADPPERTIIRIKELFDIGPVTYPAYPDTTVDTKAAKRSLDLHKAQVEAEEKRLKDEEGTEQTDEEKTQEQKCKRQRNRKTESGYRKAKRIIERNKSAEV